MKNTVITSILATFALSFLALFNSTSKNIFKSKVKIQKDKETITFTEEEDKFDLFI